MNQGTLVRKNLTRKMLRTTLLAISILIAFLLFGVLGSFNYVFSNVQNFGGANRLIAVNKLHFTVALPYAHVERVRAMDGVTEASAQQWFGGYYREPRYQLQTLAVEPERYLRIYEGDLVLPEEQRRAFISNRVGIIIGRDTAAQYGIKVGDRIPLHSSIFTNRASNRPVWDFDVVGIFTARDPDAGAQGAFISYEYFRESNTFGRDFTGNIAIRTASADANDAVAKRIDEAFANSRAETRTQDEAAFNRAFLGQFGDISFIITLVVGAAFAAILLVVGNTMWMAVRERTKEIGVLKTLGFTDARIMRMIMGESVLLSLIGAGLGLGLAALVLLGLSAALRAALGGMEMQWPIALGGLGLALLFGLVTGAAPAWAALNLKIVDALGRK